MKLNYENLHVKKEKKKFLKLYNEKYYKLKKDLKQNQTFISKVESLELDAHQYSEELSRKVMLQLVFLYFLQNKQKSNNSYIRDSFEACIKNKKNFFKDYLQPLFYQTPNALLKIALFKPSIVETQGKINLDIPNEIFSNKHLSGEHEEGLLDVLDNFNFTLEGKGSMAKAIAIGPEILEGIFESFLKDTDKRSKGVYYTSKEIVAYMCQESLIYYLVKEVELPYQVIKEFIKEGKLNSNKDIGNKVLEIDVALENIKVADLAVGSGAYPLGMLNEIAKARNNITKYISDKSAIKDGSLYQFKLNAIRSSIFAMDIDARAIEITQWRLYLSLMAEQDVEAHVDMNIYVGNSLLDVFKRMDTGFDVITGNPPYIGEKGNKEIFREITNTDFGEKYYQGKMDLFYFFFHRAIDLCKNGGIISFITTNYFTTADGALKLRLDIQNRTQVLKLVNFKEVKLFESAMGQHSLISILKKGTQIKKQDTEVITIEGQKKVNSYICKCHEIFEGEKAYIRIRGHGDNNIESILNKISRGIKLGELCYVNQGIVSGADTLTDRHISRFEINGKKGEGIFVLKEDEIRQKHFICNELEILKPFFKNSDITRYHANHTSDKRIIYIDKSLKDIVLIYPNIAKHLQKYYPILSKRREALKGYIDFFHLHWSRNERIFLGEKIIAPQRSLLNTFAYNNIPWYSSADVYYITPKSKKINLKYILGILNSKLYYIWFYYRGKRKGETLELYQTPLKETPILFTTQQSHEIIKLVDQMLIEEDTKKKERIQYNIDQIVYKIYHLTPEEIQSIEK